MDFDSIVLIHREKGAFLKEGISIKVESCLQNIKSFYEEEGKIFLVLNLEEDFKDEEFDKIFEEFPYEEFENEGINIYPKDEEYYPTFIVEIENKPREELQKEIDLILEIFMEKVVKIYCNNI